MTDFASQHPLPTVPQAVLDAVHRRPERARRASTACEALVLLVVFTASCCSSARATAPESIASVDGSWVQEGLPILRAGHSSIHDPLRSRMVVFGGANAYETLDDVWELSLTGDPTWTRLTPVGTPPSARYWHSAIYDPIRDRMVVFGGTDNVTNFSEVWTLSLAGTPVWVQLAPAGAPPPARYGHSAIYDPVRDRMLVFGGSGTSDLNDVWELSLAGSPAWTQLTPAGTPPSARELHSAIYDSVRDRMVVFGGAGASNQNDVWELSLAGSPAWTQLAPTGTPPSARSGHTAIHDPVGDRMVVFGGNNTSCCGNKNDVWELSLESPAWSQITPAGTPPTARSYQGGIYDPGQDRLVAFGGSGNGYVYRNDSWALPLTGPPAWTQLATAQKPPSARKGHSMVYDPVRDRMVLFGGNNGTCCTNGNDVWTLSFAGGPAWAQLTPGGTPPSAREWQSAIYDPVRDRMVVFGGESGLSFYGDVWALSLAGDPAWTQIAAAGTPPGARSRHSAIYDPVRDRMVVFGGYNGSSAFNDVWELSLTGTPTWTKLAAGGTGARLQHTAIYDPVRDRMIVFGGNNGTAFFNDALEFSLTGNTTWTPLTPAGTPPSVRFRHRAVYDPVRDRMVVFGGTTTGLVDLNDVWALSLATSLSWTPVTPDGIPPSVRDSHSLIYDPLRDRLVTFGGLGGNTGVLDDLWALTLPATVSVPPGAGGDALELTAAYPNPSLSEVTFRFALKRSGATTLRVYDASGREVRTLVDGPLPAGTRSVPWDRRLPTGSLAQPGVYFYELRANGRKVAAGRFALLR